MAGVPHWRTGLHCFACSRVPERLRFAVFSEADLTPMASGQIVTSILLRDGICRKRGWARRTGFKTSQWTRYHSLEIWPLVTHVVAETRRHPVAALWSSAS